MSTLLIGAIAPVSFLSDLALLRGLEHVSGGMYLNQWHNRSS
jgi:hypothetical protein